MAGVNPNDPFGVASGEPLPEATEVDELIKNGNELSGAMGALLDRLDGTARQKRDEIIEKKRSAIRGLQENIPGVGKIGPKDDAIKAVLAAAVNQAEKEAARYRRDLCAEHEAHCDAMMNRLNKTAERLATLVRTYPSPQALLSVQRLGDPKRSEYHRQVEHAGPVELTTLARLAIQTGDRALAAAVLAKNDQTPRESRQFSSAQFARRNVGEEHDKYVAAHKLLANMFQSTRNRLWSMKTGKPLPLTEKVKQGLRNDELARLGVGIAYDRSDDE